MRTEFQVGDIIVYRAADPERSYHMIYLGDGFYFCGSKVRRNRKKLHKIASEIAEGKPGRFCHFKRI